MDRKRVIYKTTLVKEKHAPSVHPIIEKMFEGENPSRIFEVGCGVGLLFDKYFNDNLNIEAVGGLDISETYIQGVKLNYPELANNFFVWDATKIPWPLLDKCYDIVFTVGTLLVIPDPTEVIREMLRVGKKAIIAELHDETQSALGDAVMTDSIYGYRIHRDYKKLFKEMRIKNYEIIDTVGGKTIIKIK